MLRRVAAFCRPLRPVLLLVSFPRSRSPVVGVLGAVLDVAGCAVCASAAPSSWRIEDVLVAGPPPPCASDAESQETDGQTGSACWDQAVPMRGNLKEPSGKQRSDGLSCLDQAVVVQGAGGGRGYTDPTNDWGGRVFVSGGGGR